MLFINPVKVDANKFYRLSVKNKSKEFSKNKFGKEFLPRRRSSNLYCLYDVAAHINKEMLHKFGYLVRFSASQTYIVFLSL